MKVTTEHVMALCEEVNKLKRLGDMLAAGEDYKDAWLKETVASCELANSLMNNMTSVDSDHAMDTRTQVALSILLNILTHEQSKPTFMLDKIDELARRAVLLANALLNQLAADAMLDQLAEEVSDKIMTEDSRKYWRGRNSELKKSLAALEAELKQAKDDEAWALGSQMFYISTLGAEWHTTYVNPTTREETRAAGPTIAAALRALRAKVEGGAR